MTVFSPGFIFPNAAGAVTLAKTFLSSPNNITGSNTVFSFTSYNIGTAAADRNIVIVVHSRNNGTAATATVKIIVAGQSDITMTADVQFTSGQMGTHIFHANVPAVYGTSATIQVTFTAVMQSTRIAGWNITGSTALTKVDSKTASTSSPAPGALTAVAGGVAIAGTTRDSISRSATWTGATADYNNQSDAGGNYFAYGASALTPTTSITISNNLINDNALSFADVTYSG